MKTDDFNFDLPEELIAQYPVEQRGQSRLMVLDRRTGSIAHSMVEDIASFLPSGSLMIFNDSKVRKARVYGTCDQTGARVEFIFLAPLASKALISIASHKISFQDDSAVIHPGERIPAASRIWRAVCSKSRRQKPYRSYTFPGALRGTIVEDVHDEKIVEFSSLVDDGYFEKYGHVPLPPYIKREDTAEDEQRYQTVYAKRMGSSASPTAGLHFTPEMIERLKNKGIEIEYITLHVGLGTFLPVRTDSVEDHQMHEEWFEISPHVANRINGAKAEKRKVYAVGTTSLRALESAWFDGSLHAGSYTTRIFIYPGFEFHLIDGLFTNFHTPKSTLVMLVSAFAGREKIFEAYRHAIREKYRFFSYGDAMLIQ